MGLHSQPRAEIKGAQVTTLPGQHGEQRGAVQWEEMVLRPHVRSDDAAAQTGNAHVGQAKGVGMARGRIATIIYTWMSSVWGVQVNLNGPVNLNGHPPQRASVI